MRVCGIDPGANGAICVLDSQDPAYIALLDLKKHNLWYIDHWFGAELFGAIGGGTKHIWIEDVHSMHGMSAKSNFNFGKNLGIVIAMASIMLVDPPNMVTPKIWQKYIGVTAKGKAIKKQVAKIAQYLYPQAELHGKQGGLLDGRSDSLMIAYYGLHYKEKV